MLYLPDHHIKSVKYRLNRTLKK